MISRKLIVTIVTLVVMSNSAADNNYRDVLPLSNVLSSNIEEENPSSGGGVVSHLIRAMKKVEQRAKERVANLPQTNASQNVEAKTESKLARSETESKSAISRERNFSLPTAMINKPFICDLGAIESADTVVYIHFHGRNGNYNGTQNASYKFITDQFDVQFNFFGRWEMIDESRFRTENYVFNYSNLAYAEGYDIEEAVPFIKELENLYLLELSGTEETLTISYRSENRLILIDDEGEEWDCRYAEKSEIKREFGFTIL